MGRYVIKRVLVAIPQLFMITLIAFIVIQLPPGDYLTSYLARLSAEGQDVDEAEISALKHRYGLDKPAYIQYFYWLKGLLHGDFGMSFEWNRPVRDLIWERLGLTFLIASCSLIFTWIVAFLIGTYSATHQYSLGDYFFTFIGFIGLAIPSFLLALIFMWISFAYFGQSVGGLFSPEFQSAAWSFDKFIDLLKHLWIPMLIIGMAGTAVTIRVLRANLIDELHKPYVLTAKAKGLPSWRVTFEYPVRVAIIPFISIVGWSLPIYISGEIIVSVVLSLPTTGPLLLRALKTEDMYLAGAFIMMLGFLTVIGTIVSDLLLALVDPRIKFE